MTIIKNIFLFLFFSLITTLTLAASFCDGTEKNPCIVLHHHTPTGDVKNFRDSQMIADAYQGNTAGLNNLWISASSAPNEKGFSTIAKNITLATKGDVKEIIDIDLRQESHGYLNGEPINLTTQFNWVNKNKTNEESIFAEEEWLHSFDSQQ